MADLHRTLARQLTRLGLRPDAPPDGEAWATLLQRISATYEAADSDRYTLERSIDLSGREMHELHQRLSAQHAQAQALLAHLPSAVIELDRGGRVRFANVAAERLVQLPAPALQGAPVLDLMALSGGPVPADAEALAGDAPIDAPDGKVLVGGRSLPCAWRLDPLRREGAASGWVLVVHDLTPLKEREDQAREARFEAEVATRAARARADFLAGMSHELRTPLNAILGYGELLLEELGDAAPALVPDMERVVVAARHLLELVSDVLDLLKIDAGRMVLRSQDVDLHALVAQVADSARVLAERNGNRLETELGPGTERMHGDPLRVRQCLLNLLSNAAKFTTNGRVALRVQRDGPRLTFEVRDTGPGIPADKLARLFQPFVQVTPGERHGTGLGLALTRSFAEQMGGTVTGASVVGQGSTFTLVLPVRLVREVTPVPT